MYLKSVYGTAIRCEDAAPDIVTWVTSPSDTFSLPTRRKTCQVR